MSDRTPLSLFGNAYGLEKERGQTFNILWWNERQEPRAFCDLCHQELLLTKRKTIRICGRCGRKFKK